MRLWSINPKYLDSKGLVAVWREGLLAKKVLEGKTKGYKNHPQLERFKQQKDPVLSINTYLWSIVSEAKLRGYNFDSSKLLKKRSVKKIKVTKGQIIHETLHLKKKLVSRDKKHHDIIEWKREILPHPLFLVVSGDIESWEKIFDKNKK